MEGRPMTPTAHPIEEIIRVLFIEDDPAVSAGRTKPDMIFIDLRVGDEQGFATLQRLRATAGTRELPVIILSNEGAGELAGRGFKADLLDYVVGAAPSPAGLAWNLEAWARAGSGS